MVLGGLGSCDASQWLLKGSTYSQWNQRAKATYNSGPTAQAESLTRNEYKLSRDVEEILAFYR